MVLPKVIGALRSYAPKLAKPKGKPSEKVLDLGKAKAKAALGVARGETAVREAQEAPAGGDLLREVLLRVLHRHRAGFDQDAEAHESLPHHAAPGALSVSVLPPNGIPG